MQLGKRGEIMVDIDMLKEKIKESGMTITAISKKTGILRETIYNRLNDIGEFTASEIVRLTAVLRLTKSERDQIFLSKKLN